MEKLFLADLADFTEDQIISHIASDYEVDLSEVQKFELLVAYESVGCWGCDSTSFFLMRDKETGQLFENHGSHCSCYGFEGQFKPEETNVVYLIDQAENGHLFSTGGYDNYSDDNKKQALKWVLQNYRNNVIDVSEVIYKLPEGSERAK